MWSVKKVCEMPATLILVIVGVLALPTFGQEKAAERTIGPFKGIVVDPAGKPAAGATVWVVNRSARGDSHIVARATADEQGRFGIAEIKWDTAAQGGPFPELIARDSQHRIGGQLRYSRPRIEPPTAEARLKLQDVKEYRGRLTDTAGEPIPVPREAALARAIARWIAQMDPWEVDRERWGRRIADMRHAPKTPQQLASRILQRVEIDHSPLKVVVGTEAGPIGQPWLTILIDYYSRLVVGFCLGFEPPSYAVIMESLRHAILPKTYLSQRFPKVQGSWPCCGLPEKLVADRGSDLTSNDLEDAGFQLGIELDFNPPRTPHFKGTVESFFDGLNDQLMASLPGHTFRNWADRADYKPDDGPLLSYEALLEILHIYLVDVYSIAKHPTAETSRLEMWQESAAVHSPLLPAAADDLLVLLAKHADRTLSARGIELGGMFYTSDDLMALRAEMAAHNITVDRLSVRYNPWDLGEVWVLNPVDSRYIKATAVDPAMKNMTAYQWRVLKRAIRERFDGPEHLQSLSAGRNAIREVAEEAARKPSRSRRVRAARYLQPPPSTMNSPVEPADLASAGSPPAAAAPSCEEPAIDADHADDQPPASSLPTVDPSEIDVSDWEVTSPDIRAA